MEGITYVGKWYYWLPYITGINGECGRIQSASETIN